MVNVDHVIVQLAAAMRFSPPCTSCQGMVEELKWCFRVAYGL
jgi:hypothetical protein